MTAKRNPSEPASTFYQSQPIEMLALEQGVGPMDPAKWQAMKTLADVLWPDDPSQDAFQAFISEIRDQTP